MTATHTITAAERPILFLTSGRADWGKVEPVVSCLGVDGVACAILAVGGHHLDVAGRTFARVVVDAGRADLMWARTHVPGLPTGDYARTVEAVGQELRRSLPRMLVVHGDRLEAAAASQAAWAEGVPVVHLEAGERSGWRDDGWSRTITTLARGALCATHDAAGIAHLLLNGGDDSWGACNVGCPGYDELVDVAAEETDKRRLVLFLLHPEGEGTGELIRRVVDAMVAVQQEAEVLGWWPNHDHGADQMASVVRDGGQPGLWYKHVTRWTFLHLLRDAHVIVGNSSTGIREAGCFGTWAVDCGLRQQGRAPVGLHVVHSDGDDLTTIILDLLGTNPPEPWWGYGNDDGKNARRCADWIARCHA